jgi:hypothetical protein
MGSGSVRKRRSSREGGGDALVPAVGLRDKVLISLMSRVVIAASWRKFLTLLTATN